MVAHILAHRKLRQKDCEFEASFAYIANPSLNMHVHTLAHIHAFTHVHVRTCTHSRKERIFFCVLKMIMIPKWEGRV